MAERATQLFGAPATDPLPGPAMAPSSTQLSADQTSNSPYNQCSGCKGNEKDALKPLDLSGEGGGSVSEQVADQPEPDGGENTAQCIYQKEPDQW